MITKLMNDGLDSIGFLDTTWRGLLDLAKSQGWEPRNPESPSEWVPYFTGWEGDYPGDFNTRVGREDADALADALERAIPKISSCREINNETAPEANDPLTQFAGRRELVAEAAGFIRTGEFQILEESAMPPWGHEPPIG